MRRNEKRARADPILDERMIMFDLLPEHQEQAKCKATTKTTKKTIAHTQFFI
jgi:hypothetical protein